MAFYLYAAIGLFVLPLLVLGLLLEFWKKLWLASTGEVTALKVTSSSSRREGRVTAIIQYRYSYRGESHLATTSKVTESEYHQEKQVVLELEQKFAVGSKIVVFHPRSIPSYSSITPGGAGIPKLLTGILLVLGLLVLVYYYHKLR